MATDGQMGECPDWFTVVQAARYLGVAPWELLTKPVFWMRAALEAQAAEVREERRRNQRKE